MLASFSATSITTAIPLLWMLLVVFPRAVTALCTFNGGTGSPVISGDTITCGSDALSCGGGTISGCDNVICDSVRSCANAMITGAKNVDCIDNFACQFATIQQIQEGGQITCGSPSSFDSCDRAKIGTDGGSGKFDVLCSGNGACLFADLMTTGIVVCDGGDTNPACETTDIVAACLVCNDDVSCSSPSCEFTDLSESSGPCPANGGATCSDAEQICLSATQDLTNCQLLNVFEDDFVSMIKDHLAVISSQEQLILTTLAQFKTNLKKKDEVAASIQKDVDELNVALKNIQKTIVKLTNNDKKNSSSCKK